MKIEHVSVSRIQLYIECPFRYGLRYDLPKEDRPLEEDNFYLNRGSAVHEAIEKILEDYKQTGEWSVMKVQKIWENVAVSYGMMPDDLKDGQKKLTVWARRLEWPEHILEIEKRYEYEVDDIPIVFVPDLIEEINEDGKKILKVTDWKTNWFPYSVDKMSDDLQAPFYISQMKKLFPDYDEYRFFFDFVYANSVVEYKVTDDKPEIVERMLLEYYKLISNDKNPKATPNEHCNNCPGAEQGLCPVLQQIIKSRDIPEEVVDDLVKEVLGDAPSDELNGFIALDMVMSGLEKIIKARKNAVRKNIKGILKKDDKERYDLEYARVSFSPKRFVSYRPTDLLKCIGNKPITINSIMKVNKTELDKVISSGLVDDDIIRKLEDTAEVNFSAPVLRITKKNARKKTKKNVWD